MTHGRKACTSGDHCRPTSLDEAIYCAVNHSADEPKVIAERLGVRLGYLYQAANPDAEDKHLQARLLLPLVQATGNTAPVEYLARACGGVFVPLPDAPPTCVRGAALALTAQMGRVAVEVETALEDGRIDQVEAEAVHRELQALVHRVAEKMAVVRRDAAGAR